MDTPSSCSPAPLVVVHPDGCRSCIDAVLASLAKQHGAVADQLLDLKLDTQRRRDPSGCVGRYFEILGRLPRAERGGAEIAQVRAWLESLIEIKAEAHLKARPAKTVQPWRMPLYLAAAQNLDEYCGCVIGDVRDQYAGQPCEVQLSFRYRAA